MESIVAVEVQLADGARRYFLTWGRIQDPVDPRPLADTVLRNAHIFELGGEPVSARVLWDLQPVTAMPYFVESFFHMCQERIPSGRRRYERWRRRIAGDQKQGKAIWYLGYGVPRSGDEQEDKPDATLT